MSTPPKNVFPDGTIVVKKPKTSDPKFEFEVDKTTTTETIYSAVLEFDYVKSDGSTGRSRADHDNGSAESSQTFNVIFDVSKTFLEKEWKASTDKVLNYSLAINMKWKTDNGWNDTVYQYHGTYQPNPDGSFEDSPHNTIAKM